MENSKIILDKLTAIESLLEATHLDKLTVIESLLEATHQVKPRTLVEAAKFLDLSPLATSADGYFRYIAESVVNADFTEAKQNRQDAKNKCCTLLLTVI